MPEASAQAVEDLRKAVAQTGRVIRPSILWGAACGKSRQVVHQMYSAFTYFLHSARRKIASVTFDLSALSTVLIKRATNYIKEIL